MQCVLLGLQIMVLFLYLSAQISVDWLWLIMSTSWVDVNSRHIFSFVINIPSVVYQLHIQDIDSHTQSFVG